jgi:hypothetical protein
MSAEINGAKHYACSSHLNGRPYCCKNNARLHRDKAEAGVLERFERIFLAPDVLAEAQPRARAAIRERTAKPQARNPRALHP